MNEQNNGGPAFPQHGFDNIAERFTSQGGMTLRDYFAAKASEDDIKFWMPMGVLVETVRETGYGKAIHHVPGMYTREKARYRYADSMLKARQA